MPTVIKAGTALQKRLYVVDSSLAAVRRINTKPFGRFFVLAFLLDGVRWDESTLRSAISTLLDKGAVYLLFHGTLCLEAEHIADRVIVERLGDKETADNVIMTTSHTGMLLGQFVEIATMRSWPAKSYIDSWESDVFICLNGRECAAEVAELLR